MNKILKWKCISKLIRYDSWKFQDLLETFTTIDYTFNLEIYTMFFQICYYNSHLY